MGGREYRLCDSSQKVASNESTESLWKGIYHRLLARRSTQSILKEMSPEYLLEELVLKLKLRYFDHLMQRTDSFVKTLLLGKIEGKRRGDNRG